MTKEKISFQKIPAFRSTKSEITIHPEEVKLLSDDILLTLLLEDTLALWRVPEPNRAYKLITPERSLALIKEKVRHMINTQTGGVKAKYLKSLEKTSPEAYKRLVASSDTHKLYTKREIAKKELTKLWVAKLPYESSIAIVRNALESTGAKVPVIEFIRLHQNKTHDGTAYVWVTQTDATLLIASSKKKEIKALGMRRGAISTFNVKIEMAKEISLNERLKRKRREL